MTARVQTQPLPTTLAGARSTGRWGLLVMLLTQAALFGALLASFFFLRLNASTWPIGGLKPPALVIPGINTVLLAAGSLCLWWAEHSIRRGGVERLKLGLVAAFVFGAAFLGLQIFD